jgi:DUF1707 SHOCT-like domain
MSEQTNYARHLGPRDRKLRVGDHERDAVAEILRQEHVKGRLDEVEFQQRLDACLVAKTYANLDALIADLPSDEPPRHRRPIMWPPRPWPVGLVPLAMLALIIGSGAHALWFAFPLFALFVLRPLFWHPWGRGYRRYGRW